VRSAAGALVFLTLLVPRGAHAQEQIGIAVGDTAPHVIVQDLDGNPVDLSTYVGRKPVLLEFWATWCPLCKALMPKIEAAHAKYGDKVDFLVIAVAVNQTPHAVRRYLESHEMPGRVLWDDEGQAVRGFMTPSTSYVVTLNAAGKVVYTGLGSDQDIDAAVARALGP
jgi:thiol-disulfide isomerase/thioredoxin